MPRSRQSRYSDEYRLLLERLVTLRGETLQATVAEHMGTSQSMLSKLERGVVRMDLADLLSYLDAVNKDPVEFVSEYIKAINWPTSKRRSSARSK